MSKYIGVKDIKNAFIEIAESGKRLERETTNNIIKALGNLPTVDLVTCDECRYRDNCMGVVEQWMFDGEEIIDSALSIRYCSGGEEKVED